MRSSPGRSGVTVRRFTKSDGIPGVTCKQCGSSDIWRVPPRKGIVAAFMKFRGLVPYQCRGCWKICYPTGKETEDEFDF